MSDYYLTSLKKYENQIHTIKMLLKNSAVLKEELEIQSENFGNGRSLSIERYSFEDVCTTLRSNLYSHFSDTSHQDKVTINAHMTEIFENLQHRK